MFNNKNVKNKNKVNFINYIPHIFLIIVLVICIILGFIYIDDIILIFKSKKLETLEHSEIEKTID